ncbi:MAG: peptide-methionine (S)-S-oxide reductase MsrA [Vicinamibacterales bacterium]
METATFGAGCFWGVEEAFRTVDGVVATAAGYAGGATENPAYKEVCSGRTGHAEVVQVEFDPARVGYEQLLDLFWSIHDPTQLNRQGPDVGTQYRTVIFYHSDSQREAATASREAVGRSGRFARPVATEIEPAATFWRAEDYHQQYIARGGRGACAISPPS